MKDFSKYQGIIPAFYACYDASGAIDPAAVRALTEYFIGKGVKGLYVGGSSGECIYQSVAERKLVGDTDVGREIKEKIQDLEKLLGAYRSGAIVERFPIKGK